VVNKACGLIDTHEICACVGFAKTHSAQNAIPAAFTMTGA